MRALHVLESQIVKPFLDEFMPNLTQTFELHAHSGISATVIFRPRHPQPHRSLYHRPRTPYHNSTSPPRNQAICPSTIACAYESYPRVLHPRYSHTCPLSHLQSTVKSTMLCGDEILHVVLYIASLRSGGKCACGEDERVVCSNGPEVLFPGARSLELDRLLLGLPVYQVVDVRS